MYFSVITPADGRERDAAHERARGAYDDHQWLWTFLPAPAGSPRDFLFRRGEVDGLPRFHLVSAREPVAPSGAWRVRSQPYHPQLRAGLRLKFELTANPVVTSRSEGGKVVRHDVVMHEKKRLLRERGLARWADWNGDDRPNLPDIVCQSCTAWLTSRAERLGIEIHDVTAEGYTQHRGRSGELRFSSIEFAGTLGVVDPAALLAALHGGVGHAKAFGCGLLLVRALG